MFITSLAVQPGLLERPLVLEDGTKRQRKKVERIEVSAIASPTERIIIVPEGSGTKLGDIPRIEFQLNRTLAGDLKPLHRLLFGKVGGVNSYNIFSSSSKIIIYNIIMWLGLMCLLFIKKFSTMFDKDLVAVLTCVMLSYYTSELSLHSAFAPIP